MFNIYKGRFHLTKTFETLETAASGTEFLGAKLNGKKTSGKIFSKNLGIPREVVPFLEILENAVLEVAENSNQTFWLNGKRLKGNGSVHGLDKC